MFLLMTGVGMDPVTIFVILFLLVLLGVLVFYGTRMLLRKVLKGVSDKKINIISRISAFVFSPILLIGITALIIYALYSITPEEQEKLDHETMDHDLQEVLAVGMSKKDVVRILGKSDTTHSVMLYDMSFPEHKEKYILEITFENGRLVRFQRKQ